MAFYWVNLGTTHKEVMANNFLWAPTHKVSKGKKVYIQGFTNVSGIKKGDVIFCHKSVNIISVAVAIDDARLSQRPDNRSFDKWGRDGFKVDVKLIELKQKLDTSLFRDELFERYNHLCSPRLLNEKTRHATESYMTSIPDAAAMLIFSFLEDDMLNIAEKQASSGKGKKRIKKTEREAIVRARVGQGQFRKDLFFVWENKCPITGIDIPELLIASHILPWALSNDEEKIDPNNGILLSPTIDKLFDKGFISFSDEGSLLVNPDFNEGNLLKLGIDKNVIRINFNTLQKGYLAKHREIFEF